MKAVRVGATSSSHAAEGVAPVVGKQTLAEGIDNVTDTHWMPTSAVRAADFTPTATPPRTLPALMISSQVYQYSTDNSTWTTFAGPFTLTRTFDGAPGAQTFATNKSGVHSVSEPYKP